jgi:hypothetical protein
VFCWVSSVIQGHSVYLDLTRNLKVPQKECANDLQRQEGRHHQVEWEVPAGRLDEAHQVQVAEVGVFPSFL